jgi:hypothetical protein
MELGAAGMPESDAGGSGMTGRLVYVIGELDGSICVFDYDAATRTLAEMQAISALPPDFQGKPSAADLRITPDGKFLYGSERTSSTLVGFRVDPANGTLALIGSVPTEEHISLLVLTPLRIQGATGSPLRALAVAPQAPSAAPPRRGAPRAPDRGPGGDG